MGSNARGKGGLSTVVEFLRLKRLGKKEQKETHERMVAFESAVSHIAKGGINKSLAELEKQEVTSASTWVALTA